MTTTDCMQIVLLYNLGVLVRTNIMIIANNTISAVIDAICNVKSMLVNETDCPLL